MSDLDTIAKQSAESNKVAREAREQSRKDAEEQFKKDRADMEKRNLAKMEADAKLRPTPTPEEIHQALAGHNVAVKEPDGSPLQNERHHTANVAQQIEVGREIPPAQPVGSDADIANQKSATGQASTDKSGMAEKTSTPKSPLNK